MGYIKKMVLVGFLCSILLVLTGCGKTETRNVTVDIKDVLLLKSGIENENNTCVVQQYQPDMFFAVEGVASGEYAVLENITMTSKTIPNAKDSGVKLITIEKLEYRFYDVHNREEIKVIDLKNRLEEKSIAKEWKGYQYDHISFLYYFQGDPCINIWFNATPTKTSTEEENNNEMAIRLNLDTEEMKVLEQKDIDQVLNAPRFYEYQWNQSVFGDMSHSNGDSYGFWEMNGFPSYSYTEAGGVSFVDRDNQGTVCIKISSDYLPNQNEKLYAEFPELKEYAGKDGYVIDIYLTNYPSAEDIIGYFLEDGQEVSFEGAILSGEKSIDGQPHDIHSFDEYYQWRKPLEEDTSDLFRMIN